MSRISLIIFIIFTTNFGLLCAEEVTFETRVYTKIPVFKKLLKDIETKFYGNRTLLNILENEFQSEGIDIEDAKELDNKYRTEEAIYMENINSQRNKRQVNLIIEGKNWHEEDVEMSNLVSQMHNKIKNQLQKKYQTRMMEIEKDYQRLRNRFKCANYKKIREKYWTMYSALIALNIEGTLLHIYKNWPAIVFPTNNFYCNIYLDRVKEALKHVVYLHHKLPHQLQFCEPVLQRVYTFECLQFFMQLEVSLRDDEFNLCSAPTEREITNKST